MDENGERILKEVFARLIADYQRQTPRWQMVLLRRLPRPLVIIVVGVDNYLQEYDLKFWLVLVFMISVLIAYPFAAFMHPLAGQTQLWLVGLGTWLSVLLHLLYTGVLALRSAGIHYSFTDTLLPREGE